MLKDYPIIFDQTELPKPEKWAEKYETVETVNETEAGTDQVLVARYGKLTVSAAFNCTSAMAQTFATFRDAGPISVQMYDLKDAAYKTRTMRIRGFSSTPVDHSEKVPDTNGLYEISFELKEY